jgi:hypothetical protein
MALVARVIITLYTVGPEAAPKLVVVLPERVVHISHCTYHEGRHGMGGAYASRVDSAWPIEYSSLPWDRVILFLTP